MDLWHDLIVQTEVDDTYHVSMLKYCSDNYTLLKNEYLKNLKKKFNTLT